MNFAQHNYTRADLKRFHKEAKWVDDHFDELHAKYPEQFVGIYKGEVIAASPDLFKVADDIAAKSLKVSDVFINFIPYEQTAWICTPFRAS